MRRGEQSAPTITRVEELVATINNSTILPPGVQIERIYDRKDLIQTTTKTVLENMVLGIVLIVRPASGCSWEIWQRPSSWARRFRSRCSSVGNQHDASTMFSSTVFVVVWIRSLRS